MIKVHCPICNRPMEGESTADWPQFPFCSPRCQTVDLGRWLGERYRVVPEAAGEPPQGHAEEDDVP
jgi:endogenous inhibitor of DNA gyrase (YacG/DUF329 family)